MAMELQTGIIAAAVAVLTAGLSGYLTWKQIQRERAKWVTELKTAYALELHKARLSSYPAMQEIIGQLSSHAQTPLTPQQAQSVAQAINRWNYTVGGLVAETNTRGAILGLRDACAAWKEGPQPKEILHWRNAALFLLRRDLDVHGLESADVLMDRLSLLAKLQKEISDIKY
jgi:hypothetical protein